MLTRHSASFILHLLKETHGQCQLVCELICVFTDFLTPSISILSCLLSPPTPEGVYTVIARGGPRADGCDVEALGLCWREAGATTGIPHTWSAIYKTMSPVRRAKNKTEAIFISNNNNNNNNKKKVAHFFTPTV